MTFGEMSPRGCAQQSDGLFSEFEEGSKGGGRLRCTHPPQSAPPTPVSLLDYRGQAVRN